MAIDKFPIEAGHILMFARSIGDENPIYADAGYAASTEPGGIIAPPTFMQASAQFEPDNFLRPKAGEPWFGSGKEPTTPGSTIPGTEECDSGGGILHAEQHFEFHRHPQAGDVLTAMVKDGKTWEKQSRNGSTLRFKEDVTEYRDQNGELVVTATGVGVTTEGVADK
ncbi:MAG: FAS1-like dehydratase domain-containing protein [Pseudomonadales bacterium]